MIEVNNITVSYPDFKLDCSLKVESGRITGLVGENGAGKTTLFMAILGVLNIENGEIILNNTNSKDMTLEKRQGLGVVLSDSFFSNRFTIKEVSKLLNSFYRGFQSEYFFKACERLNLPLNKKIKEFSTGMLAKLKVLSALSHNANTLILDEPTSGLDVRARLEILNMIHEYMEDHEDTSIIISSHISTDLEKICDDIYFIDNGSMILHEDTDVLLDSYGIIKTGNNIKMDLSYCLYKSETSYGHNLLTNERQYYKDNYPDLIVEKPTIDEIILTILEGEKI